MNRKNITTTLAAITICFFSVITYSFVQGQTVVIPLVDEIGPFPLPRGAVVFFDLKSCPSGWIELTEARGRAVVGLVSGGTLSGTTGKPLTNKEDRQHIHRVSSAPSGPSIGYSTITHGNTIYSTKVAADPHHHIIDADSDFASTSDVMPYLQLLACRKN